MNQFESASSGEFAYHLLSLTNVAEQEQFLTLQFRKIDDEVMELVKQAVEDALRADIESAHRLADLLEFAANCSKDERHRALALLAKGNIQNIGVSDFPKALGYYSDALELFQRHADLRGVARVKLGRLWALKLLGRDAEAIADGNDCIEILRELRDWKLLTIATMNLSQVYSQNGNDEAALILLEQAKAIIEENIPTQTELVAWIEGNRAISLRNMGRLEESISAGRATWARLQESGQTIEAARAQQNLAMTYYLLGRYNEALTNFDEAFAVFSRDERWANAMMVELYMTDCLLQMRRFEDVIEICQRILQRFQVLSVDQVVGEIIVNQAAANIQLGHYDAARELLNGALEIFQRLNYSRRIAMIHRDLALIYLHNSDYQTSKEFACEAASVFAKCQHPDKEAEAWLLAAESTMQAGNYCEAHRWIERAFEIGSAKVFPFVTFQSHRLLGLLLEKEGKLEESLLHLDQAIVELEQLRSCLMVEHRTTFLDDKVAIYEDAVHLSMIDDEMERALQYAERAKSRALVDLLDRRLELKIHARHPQDQALVDELQVLRQQRDQLQNRVIQSNSSSLRESVADITQPDFVPLAIIEKKITTLWHKLLTHNADYGRQANLLLVDHSAFQQYIPKNTLLLEYFVVRGRLTLFCVDSKSVKAFDLPAPWHQIQSTLQKWQLNIQAVMHNPLRQTAHLQKNALGILQQLYQSLIVPIEQYIEGKRLLVVPHGSLHFAPFHALYNGHSFLVEDHELSYLPAASLLRFVTNDRPTWEHILIYGNTTNGQLPYVEQEIAAIAKSLSLQAYHNQQYNKVELVKEMEQADIIHLATHGQFHSDNPLFSGLHVQDGWLTTLDVFNLRLKASLVTLSGCNTGRNHILGGDEVSGLMRAFLSAGAKSLLLSLWPIEDSTSAWFMEQFYCHLKKGTGKGEALRAVQLQYIRGNLPDQFDPKLTAHPFYWAPFFLVGLS